MKKLLKKIYEFLRGEEWRLKQELKIIDQKWDELLKEKKYDQTTPILERRSEIWKRLDTIHDARHKRWQHHHIRRLQSLKGVYIAFEDGEEDAVIRELERC